MTDVKRVALVTGSTSGIGLACAHALAKRGINVLLNGFGDTELINKIIADIQSYNVSVHYIAADLSKPSDIEKLWSEITNLYPEGVDILVNNAGLLFVSFVENYPEEMWDKSISVMLTAPFKLIKACIPGMKKKGWGRIVNMSSTLGQTSYTACAVYSAAKHGIIGLTKGVALEYAAYGVTCNAVCPGSTDTPLCRKFYEDMAKLTNVTVEESEASGEQTYAIKQETTTQQVAELVEFLCLSNASSQMTGAAYLIDKGYVAQ